MGTRQLLARGPLLAAIVAVALLNGSLYAPVFDAVFFLLRPAARAFFVTNTSVLFYATTALIALMTLAIAGIPAALYERLRGTGESTPASLALWLAGTLLLSLPTLSAMLLGSD
jgi:hypothetical protein